MSFRPMLRPGQGFKLFRILRRVGAITPGGRPHTGSLAPQGEFCGMLTQASPKEIEEHKQQKSPITHTITVLRNSLKHQARANDVLELVTGSGEKKRRFMVQGDPQDPGELGFFLVYKVEEREGLE